MNPGGSVGSNTGIGAVNMYGMTPGERSAANSTPAASLPPSRATSTELDGAGTDAGGLDSPAMDDMADDDDDPRELDEDDMDPINSGVQTPQMYLPPHLQQQLHGNVGARGGQQAAQPSLLGTEAQRKSKALNFLKKRDSKITIKGVTYSVVDDELMLEDDPRGETKIDANGVLLGGRFYKLHTFTSPMRANPDKLYMLSIDAARAAGFRDSLYFFRRNPLIHKLSCTQAEKDRLIDLGKLNGNLRSRAVTMVSARNVYKVMGATFVHNGKYVFDDYYEDKSLAAGHTPGEPAWIESYDPEKDSGTLASAKGGAPVGAGSGVNVLFNHSGKPRSNQPELGGSTGGANGAGVSHELAAITGGLAGRGLEGLWASNGRDPWQVRDIALARLNQGASTGSSGPSHKKQPKPLPPHVTRENWMLEYAQAVREANTELARIRGLNVGQVRLGVNENGTGAGQSDDVLDADGWEEVEVDVEVPIEEPDTSGQNGRHGDDDDDEDEEDDYYRQFHTTQSTSHHHPQSQALNGLASAAAQISHDPLQQKPTRTIRQRQRVFRPLRGFYEPETNVPHVYRSTQPTECLAWTRIDSRPRIFDDDARGDATSDGAEDEQRGSKRRRRLEDAARQARIATIEYAVTDAAEIEGDRAPRDTLLPGLWDFGAGPGWETRLELEEIVP